MTTAAGMAATRVSKPDLIPKLSLIGTYAAIGCPKMVGWWVFRHPPLPPSPPTGSTTQMSARALGAAVWRVTSTACHKYCDMLTIVHRRARGARRDHSGSSLTRRRKPVLSPPLHLRALCGLCGEYVTAIPARSPSRPAQRRRPCLPEPERPLCSAPTWQAGATPGGERASESVRPPNADFLSRSCE